MDLRNALIDWDDADDETGNTAHVAEHGLTHKEVESAFLDKDARFDLSRSSGRPIAFGETVTGRYIAIVFEILNLDDPFIIRPITAYEVISPGE